MGLLNGLANRANLVTLVMILAVLIIIGSVFVLTNIPLTLIPAAPPTSTGLGYVQVTVAP
jgi:hypothetical protein